MTDTTRVDPDQLHQQAPAAAVNALLRGVDEDGVPGGQCGTFCGPAMPTSTASAH